MLKRKPCANALLEESNHVNLVLYVQYIADRDSTNKKIRTEKVTVYSGKASSMGISFAMDAASAPPTILIESSAFAASLMHTAHPLHTFF